MVAGQSPIGYERAVINHGDAPPAFVAGVRAVEAEREARRAALDRAGPAAIAASVPRLDAGVRIERKPVIEGDEFALGPRAEQRPAPRGHPAQSPRRPHARLGRRRRLDRGAERPHRRRRRGVADDPTRARLTEQLTAAASILYVDGAIEDLAGLGG